MDMIQIRASSLSELFDCPRRWQAKHLEKIRMPTSSATFLGTAVHAGTALFDQSHLDGNPLTPEEAAGAVVDVLQHPEEDVDWEDSNAAEAESVALPLHRMYCERIAPKNAYVAVEATAEDLPITDLGIVLTGTIDRVRTVDGALGIADIKTGKTAVAADGTIPTQKHAAQLGAYELLASRTLEVELAAPAQIIGLQVAKTDKGRRAATATICGARDLLLGDDNRPGMLQHASRIIHSGDFYGNPRSSLCTAKYCPAYNVCRWRK